MCECGVGGVSMGWDGTDEGHWVVGEGGAVGVLDHSNIQLGPSALCSLVVNIQSHDNNSSNDNNFTHGHKCV